MKFCIPTDCRAAAVKIGAEYIGCLNELPFEDCLPKTVLLNGIDYCRTDAGYEVLPRFIKMQFDPEINTDEIDGVLLFDRHRQADLYEYVKAMKSLELP